MSKSKSKSELNSNKKNKKGVDAPHLQRKENFFAAAAAQKKNKKKVRYFNSIKASKANSLETYESKLSEYEYLEAECNQLFSALKKIKINKENKENLDQIYMYCYYSAHMLETFYAAYDKKSKKEAYAHLKKAIKERAKAAQSSTIKKNRVFLSDVFDKILASLKDIALSPIHAASFRDNVAFANLLRLYWLFSRLTVEQGLLLAKNLSFFDFLDPMLGTHTDVDKIIAVLKAPSDILNYFSVGLFLMRTLIDFGISLKHALSPNKGEEGTPWKRFTRELGKRHCNFINDLVWASVNFITNFNKISHIPGPVTNYITSVFLLFDVSLLIYQLARAYKNYQTMTQRYDDEIEKIAPGATNRTSFPANHLKNTRLLVLHEQKKALTLEWKTKQAQLIYLASAATLLAVGFTLAMISSPLLAVASFLVCTFAIALYLSSGEFTAYQAKKLAYQQMGLDANNPELNVEGKDLQALELEFKAARRDFYQKVIKSTVMPLLLISTFAVCWPAAVILTALYLGYELLHARSQAKEKKEIEGLLSAPVSNPLPEGKEDDAAPADFNGQETTIRLK